jgi:hypothetical protein
LGYIHFGHFFQKLVWSACIVHCTFQIEEKRKFINALNEKNQNYNSA